MTFAASGAEGERTAFGASTQGHFEVRDGTVLDGGDAALFVLDGGQAVISGMRVERRWVVTPPKRRRGSANAQRLPVSIPSQPARR